MSSVTAALLIATGIVSLLYCWEYSDPEKLFEVKYNSITRKDDQIDIHVTITNKSGETVALTNVLKSCVCIDSKFEKSTIADQASSSFSYRIDIKKLDSSALAIGVAVLLKYPDNVVSSLFVPVPRQALTKSKKG